MHFSCPDPSINVRHSTFRTDYYPDEKLVERMRNYGSQEELLHTIFYGARGSGKHSLALFLLSVHFGIPRESLLKKSILHVTVKDKVFYIYKCNWYFEIMVDTFPTNQQSVIVDIVAELSTTPNVLLNRHNVIIMRNAELLERSIQQQFRRMMEIIYPTCRLLFTTSNLSGIDLAIQSRCLKVRIVADPHTEELGHGLHRTVIAQVLKFLTTSSNATTATEGAREIVKTIVIKNLLVEDILVPVIRTVATTCTDDQFRRFVRSCSQHLYTYRLGQRKNVHLESLLILLLGIVQEKTSKKGKKASVIDEAVAAAKGAKGAVGAAVGDGEGKKHDDDDDWCWA